MSQPAARDESWDVVVVGGGPAGLAAATETAAAGLRTVIVDEQRQLGGQYFKQPPSGRAAGHRPEGRRRIDAAVRAGAEVRAAHLVWGADERGALLVSDVEQGRTTRMAARFTVVAPGAHELVLPFEGWQRPGVVTPGFALHLATVDGVPVGERVLVAGTGPFLLLVALELARAGITVVGVAEHRRLPLDPSALAAGVRHPARSLQLATMLAGLARRGVPWWTSTTLLEATGPAGSLPSAPLNGAVLGTPSGRRSVEVDVVAAAYGFRPSSELARLLGCECSTDPVTAAPVPVVEGPGRTSRPGVFAVGDGAGIGGADAAAAQGRAAGLAVVGDALGPPPRRASLRRRVARAVTDARDAQLRDFATRNGSLWAPPVDDAVARIADTVVVCRCEAVTAGEIRRAVGRAAGDLHSLKAATRAGMGPCQGRSCATAVAALHRMAGGSASSAWTARMPLRPVPLAVAAQLATDPAGADRPGTPR